MNNITRNWPTYLWKHLRILLFKETDPSGGEYVASEKKGQATFSVQKMLPNTNAIIPVSSRGAKKIPSLCSEIATPFQGSQ